MTLYLYPGLVKLAALALFFWLRFHHLNVSNLIQDNKHTV